MTVDLFKMRGKHGHKPPYIERISIGDCWEWTGARTSAGYGNLYAAEHGGYETAHRAFYEALVGEIPDGKVIDHLCQVRHCVNPDHLEVVTYAENFKRGKHACPYGNPKACSTHNHVTK